MTRRFAFVLLASIAAAQDPTSVDRTHYKIEVDNEYVRVLRVQYPPGEGSPMHAHPAGVRIFLTDARSRFVLPDGSTREGVRKAGDILWSEPVRHANTNIGSTAIEILELDFKGLPQRPARPADKSAPPDLTETIVLENEFVRVLRARVAPRAESPMHKHGDRLVIALGSQQFREKVETGKTSYGKRERGEVDWSSAGAHSTRNLGKELLESVIVEFRPMPR